MPLSFRRQFLQARYATLISKKAYSVVDVHLTYKEAQSGHQSPDDRNERHTRSRTKNRRERFVQFVLFLRGIY